MTMLEIAFRVAETRAKFGHMPEAQAVIEASERWLDDWETFYQLPWYVQFWRSLCGHLPEYHSPFGDAP